jgi:hypothetical protein
MTFEDKWSVTRNQLIVGGWSDADIAIFEETSREFWDAATTAANTRDNEVTGAKNVHGVVTACATGKKPKDKEPR